MLTHTSSGFPPRRHANFKTLSCPVPNFSEVIEACCVMKMIKIQGTVARSPALRMYSHESVGDCISDTECILVIYFDNFLGSCATWTAVAEYLTVVENKDDSYVPFKVNLPNDTCPVSYEDLNFSITTGTGDTHFWKKNDTAWQFYGCREEWKRFERADDTVVCMKTNALPEITIDDARKACEAQNSVLTGVASVEESTWIREVVKTLASKSEDNYGFWIDGKRDCITEPCNTFYWTDGYTTTFDALKEPNSIVSSEKYQGAWKDCLTIAPLSSNFMVERLNEYFVAIKSWKFMKTRKHTSNSH